MLRNDRQHILRILQAFYAKQTPLVQQHNIISIPKCTHEAARKETAHVCPGEFGEEIVCVNVEKYGRNYTTLPNTVTNCEFDGVGITPSYISTLTGITMVQKPEVH